jgi:hypothetical protein
VLAAIRARTPMRIGLLDNRPLTGLAALGE